MSKGKYGYRGTYRDRSPSLSEWGQNGFPNRTDSSLAFVNGTRTFTISPTGTYFEFYFNGERRRSGADSLQISTADGQHWLYYDSDGALQEIANPSNAQVEDLIENQCLVTMVYWNNNTSEGYLFDERHGYQMSPITHSVLHECVGMLWAEGVALQNLETDESGAANTHAQCGNTSGEVYDEDVGHDIGAVSRGQYECWWWDGTRWQWDQNALGAYPFLTGATPRAQYNTGGALAEVGNGEFCLSHLFATAAENGTLIVVVGQAKYSNIAAAREGAATELSALLVGTLPTPEMKPIGTVILQSSNGYGNTPKTRTRTASGGHDYVDWRNNPISPGGGTVSDHGSLGGLPDDDHSGHPWLAGRSGGQTLVGGTDSGDDLTLQSTAHATKGFVIIADSAAEHVGVGLTSPTERLHVQGAAGTDSYIFVEDTAANSYAGLKIKNDVQQWNIQVNSSDRLEFRDVNNSTNFMTAEPGLPAATIYADSSGHVGITGAPATSAALEIESTTGALLVPRMTQAQRTALTAVNGMIVYDTTNNAFYFYENGAWVTGSGLT
jgi:YD repeat-containing protein